jgi:hypothetical protein
MYIAVSKGVGSLLGVVMSVSLYPHSFVIPVMGATVIVLDTYYAVTLYRRFGREGAAAWRPRHRIAAAPVAVPATTQG